MKLKSIQHELKRSGTGYLYLGPFLILFIIFNLVPVLNAMTMSLTSNNMIQPPSYVGLQNFETLLLSDDIFLLSLKNTLVFAIFIGPIGYMLSFVMAWLLNGMRHRKFFALCLYAPSITSGDRKSTRLNSSHPTTSRMPSSA